MTPGTAQGFTTERAGAPKDQYRTADVAARPRLVTPSSPPPGRVSARAYRAAAILVLNALVVLVCFELAARAVYEIKSWFVPDEESLVIGEGAPRETISYYATQDWGPRFWHEFRQSRQQLRYAPYVGWKRAPFEGTTIRIGQDGIRATPGAVCGPGAYTVFAFGGSTMWGTGSPDWGTIPAYLQSGLQKTGRAPVCVVNFGETAYVSTQGVITLLMQLQSGHVPDLVLFYDGPSDIYAAYQSGRSGVPQNVDRFAAIFEGRNRPHPFVDGLQRSSSFALVRTLVSRLGATKPAQEESTPVGPARAKVATLESSIVEHYLRNYTAVSALAQQHGFKFLFVWQPFISMGQKPLTEEEREIRQEAVADPVYAALLRSVYRAMEEKSSTHENLSYMAHVFDGHQPLVWIDGAHVTPPGNEIIAGKILDVVKTRGLLAGHRQ